MGISEESKQTFNRKSLPRGLPGFLSLSPFSSFVFSFPFPFFFPSPPVPFLPFFSLPPSLSGFWTLLRFNIVAVLVSQPPSSAFGVYRGTVSSRYKSRPELRLWVILAVLLLSPTYSLTWNFPLLLEYTGLWMADGKRKQSENNFLNGSVDIF